MEYEFKKWLLLKENYDPFKTLIQKQGDIVYFGIHDLSKFYRFTGELPKLKLSTLGSKIGQIVDADPIEQIVKVSVSQSPFNYGYRKLENNKDKMKRFMRDDGQMEVRISVSNLIDITHMLDSDQYKVWLVIDKNTKYQNNILKEIRKKEVHKAISAETDTDFMHVE